MAQQNPFLPVLVPLPFLLLAFWIWMFRDMLNHDDMPGLVTRDPKSDWTLAFIFLNVFAAAAYFALVYRNRHR
jgi:hypothetical protein